MSLVSCLQVASVLQVVDDVTSHRSLAFCQQVVSLFQAVDGMMSMAL